MIHGSGRCACVGTTSPRKQATSPSLSIRTLWWKGVWPGVGSVMMPGHTPHHQSVLIDGGGERALFLGDLVPTHAHLPLPWIMGYDVEPLVTLETKRRILKQALDEKWLLIFEHDAEVPWSRIENDGKAYRLVSATV